MQQLADRIGWTWVVACVPLSLWLGQGGAPCPPEGPPPGQVCILPLLPADHSLLLLAVLGAFALPLAREGRPLLSGLLVGAAGVLAGAWAATHRFLGSAWHVPRVPVVLVLALPPLLVAAERLTRRRRAGSTPTTAAVPEDPHRHHL